jgi:hypothetical protein
MLVRQLEQLRKAMAAKPDLLDVEQAKRDTIRQIESEQREAERRER